jgi:uncharacterized membrane protein
MDSKTASWVSYLGIIGWLISFFVTKDTPNRDDFSKYHLKQSLGLGIATFAYGILVNIIVRVTASGTLLSILSIGYLVFLVLAILGIINAFNGKKASLPVVGKFFEDKFNFI